jgi:restriction endonuclease Mrr
MKNNNAKQEYTGRQCTDFIIPILMSLDDELDSNRQIRNINEIEIDVCELLNISYEERSAFYDFLPNTRVLRSKLGWLLYRMRKENLIKAFGLEKYKITDEGKKMLAEFFEMEKEALNAA